VLECWSDEVMESFQPMPITILSPNIKAERTTYS